MLGAIIGDIAGSRYEHHNIKTKDFPFFSLWDSMTDDSIMTLAVAKALLASRPDRSDLGTQAISSMQELGRMFPDCGAGFHFSRWLAEPHPLPYGSWGNGAAMRVSPCGWAGTTLREVKQLSKAVTEVSHDHPEGLKGAEAVAVSVFLARSGSTKAQIQAYVQENYYDLSFTLDEIRDSYRFDPSCQGSVPQAIEAFLESDSFEDAVRNAISLGGDSDTLAAIAGSIAEAFYGIPADLRQKALTYLEDPCLLRILQAFELQFPAGIL